MKTILELLRETHQSILNKRHSTIKVLVNEKYIFKAKLHLDTTVMNTLQIYISWCQEKIDRRWFLYCQNTSLD
jgi:hypothetical protein